MKIEHLNRSMLCADRAWVGLQRRGAAPLNAHGTSCERPVRTTYAVRGVISPLVRDNFLYAHVYARRRASMDAYEA